MKARDFCYWLMGALEVGDVDYLSEEQVANVKAHLNMVFIHDIDPTFPEKQQDALNEAHEEGKRRSAGLPLNDRPGDIVMKC